jgi:hypothetical protein
MGRRCGALRQRNTERKDDVPHLSPRLGSHNRNDLKGISSFWTLRDAPAITIAKFPSQFLRPLYSYINPTFPTFATEVVDYATPILVG